MQQCNIKGTISSVEWNLNNEELRPAAHNRGIRPQPSERVAYPLRSK